MIENYTELPKFKLPDSLISNIKSLDWTELEFSYVADSIHYIFKKFPWKQSSYKNFINKYGILQQRIGTLVSAKLPIVIENQVREYINYKDPAIRLQIVFGGIGGCIIPLHVDETRLSSIVYPIQHTIPAVTNFYKSSYQFNHLSRRGSYDPADCTLIDSIVITNTPVLLNVNCIHSVESYTSISKLNPRISLSIKWQDAMYTELCNYYDNF